MRPRKIQPGPGQESVWDYPRPPRLEPAGSRIRVVFGGLAIADSTSALRVLETSHPPVYYVPPGDVLPGAIEPTAQTSFCEWKGTATYLAVRAGDRVEVDAAWRYDHPAPAYAALAGHVAFYAAAMDACFVGEEQAEAQPGGFYGGWVTSRVVGPFKGTPGSWGW